MSHVDVADDKVEAAKEIIHEVHDDVLVIDKPIESYSIEELMDLIVAGHEEECECGCHHDHEHDHECCCGHHHDHECEHDHEHEHHHHHDGECGCHHHHDHDADEVFASWGIETAHKFTKDKIEKILNIFANGTEYGMILRAKGIVEDENGEWIHFDYVPGEPDIRNGAAEVTGRLCVIGSDIDKEKIEKLFLD